MLLVLGLVVWQVKVGEAGPMGTAWTYQGQLIDANNAAEGVYDFNFGLYDTAGDGNQVGSDVNVPDVDVIDGYFTVALDFGSSVFEGDARWLEIGVRPGDSGGGFTTLSPRQELTPTPYAINADKLEGSDSTAFASSAHNHDSLYVNITGDSMSGSSSGTLLSVSNTGSGNGVNGEATGNTSMGVRGVATNTGDYTNYGGWFAAAGSTGEGVYGLATGNFGRGVVGVATNTSNNVNCGGWFMAAGGNGQAVRGVATNTTPRTNHGGWFTAAGGFGRGVRGEATNTGNYTNYGGYFEAAGAYGEGVYAEATNTGDYINYGGRFEAAASRGRGVYGKASKAGPYENYGGYFEAAGDLGRGVYGKASEESEFAYNYGGYFEAAGFDGTGVYGEATNTGDYPTCGGYFLSAGGSGRGVYGRADGDSATGVCGYGGQYDFYAAGPGTDYGTASSIRWKSDIRPIDEALGKVMRIRGVYFNWDSEHGGGHDVGMIAEEVGKVLPEIVAYEENGIDATGMDYGKLTPLLVEAVKELKAEKDAEIAELKGRLSQMELLRKENTELHQRIAALESIVAKVSLLREGGTQ
jgi:hypothetical protein